MLRGTTKRAPTFQPPMAPSAAGTAVATAAAPTDGEALEHTPAGTAATGASVDVPGGVAATAMEDGTTIVPEGEPGTFPLDLDGRGDLDSGPAEVGGGGGGEGGGGATTRPGILASGLLFVRSLGNNSWRKERRASEPDVAAIVKAAEVRRGEARPSLFGKLRLDWSCSLHVRG